MIAIQQLYKPLQPTVGNGATAISYREQSPHPRLAPLIHCYWQLTTSMPLPEPFVYRVVADGCIDLFFDRLLLGEALVMGLSTTYTAFTLATSFNYVGIRFLPTAFPLLYRVDAAQLTNRVESLGAVLPVVSRELADLLASHTTLEILCPHLDAYFVRQLGRVDLKPDPRLSRALAAILTRSGALNVLSELDTPLSHRQLSRLFQFYVGDTPKVFSRIVRFQHLLQAKPSSPTFRQDTVFYDLGYYDQAHFINEFKAFYGQTPGSLTW